MQKPSFYELFLTWLYIGLVSFGGPGGQIALMHRIVVDEKKWINEKTFLNALNFCMLLPGPEAMQLATYCGWKMRGFTGGFICGLLFVLPGALIILLLSYLYILFSDLSWVQSAFIGIKATVIIIVLQALWRIAQKTLKHWQHWMITALAFIGLYFLDINYPYIIIGAALMGLLVIPADDSITTQVTPNRLPDTGPIIRTLIIGMLIWWLPVILIWLFAHDTFLMSLAQFFAKLAVLTFGGAYAVLGYMQQALVYDYGWLNSTQMIDALGLAETTPGPLILVTQFSGYLAAYAQDGHGYAVIAALLTLWMTFVPCFIWIFVGAPYINWLSQKKRINTILSAITAAVVGVIFSIALWFGLEIFFGNGSTITNLTFSRLNFTAVGLSLLATFLLIIKLDIIITMLLCTIIATAIGVL